MSRYFVKYFDIFFVFSLLSILLQRCRQDCQKVHFMAVSIESPGGRMLSNIASKVREYRSVFALAGGLLLYCLAAYVLQLPCPIKWLTGISCPGCGMTRSFFSLLSLNIGRAIYYHPLFGAVIGAVPLWFICKVREAYRVRNALGIILAALFIAVYLYRLLILQSPVLEFAPEQGFFARRLHDIFAVCK